MIRLGEAQVHRKYTNGHPKSENKIHMKLTKMQAVQKAKRSESEAEKGEVACSHSNRVPAGCDLSWITKRLCLWNYACSFFSKLSCKYEN